MKKTAFAEKNRIIESLAKRNIVPVSSSEKQYNFEIIFGNKKEKCSLNIYFGKSGVKKVLQGKKDSEIYDCISEVLGIQKAEEKPRLYPSNYIGSDESGKGDFFGPLVVAAVYLNQDLQKNISGLGVQDSKNLSPLQIEKLGKKLLDILAGNYSTEILTPTDYNQKYSAYKNLNSLLESLHVQAIGNLLEKKKPEQIIIDEFSKKAVTFDNKYNLTGIEVIQRTKAEEFQAVAAASIIARYKFDCWFKEQENLGIILPKGASNAVDEAAAKYYKKYGDAFFEKYAKLHFKNFIKMKNIKI
ncbi:MAG: ribonuclease HIII [Ignavibacteria bacterium]|nr:ribonuclease HIII [Ignavibacteria bacterium]